MLEQNKITKIQTSYNFIKNYNDPEYKLEMDRKNAKFVLCICTKTRDLTLKLFPNSTTHAKYDPCEKQDFVGAGIICNNEPKWGSQSCLARYKCDRPADEKEAKALLQEVRTTFSELIKQHISPTKLFHIHNLRYNPSKQTTF